MTDLERQERMAEAQRELNASFARTDNEQENADVKAVLGTEAGRRLFSGIIGRGGVFGMVWPSSQGDAVRLAFETGRREYAVDIYRRANAIAPELVLKAVSERNAVYAGRREKMNAVREEFGNGKEETR